MRIADMYGGDDAVFSFEFFPPKTAGGEKALRESLRELTSLAPDFVSVTYGAGGSTRSRTIELVTQLKEQFGLEAMAHLTCVGAAPAELTETLDRLEAAGVENVIALRGDPPNDGPFEAAPDGPRYASELVRFIRGQNRPFCLAGACYPETHLEAESAEADLAHLVEKVGAGVEVLITQLFFDNDYYFSFVDRARAAGIDVPIVAGIMPIANLAQIERFTDMCGSTIPESLHDRLRAVADDADAVAELGIEQATAQCRELIERGAPGVHFYTLNKSRATRRVLEALRGG